MAFTQDDMDAIEEAISCGELKVKVRGREIEYRSMADLQKARRMIGRALARQNGRASSPLAGITSRIDRGIR